MLVIGSTGQIGEQVIVLYEVFCCFWVTRWWPRRELNPRHKDFQSSALPTELLGHCNIPHAMITIDTVRCSSNSAPGPEAAKPAMLADNTRAESTALARTVLPNRGFYTGIRRKCDSATGAPTAAAVFIAACLSFQPGCSVRLSAPYRKAASGGSNSRVPRNARRNETPLLPDKPSIRRKIPGPALATPLGSGGDYSTVTDFAKLRGLSMSVPFSRAV